MDQSRKLARLVVALGVCGIFAGCGLIEDATTTVSGEGETAAPTAGVEDEPSAEVELEDDEPEAELSDGEDRAPVDDEPATPATEPEPIEMPELIGMTEAEARGALQEFGLGEPSVEPRQSFDPPGTVLEQVPSSGEAVTGTVSLVVAESIQPMPDFADQKIADVRRWADPLGIEVRTETVLRNDKQTDQIVAQIPAPGAEVSQEVLVTLAETPTSVLLSKLETVESRSYRVSDISMNGNTYNDVVTLSVSSRNGHVSYNLSRDWSTLKVDLGVSDVESASAVVQVEISGDGEVLYSSPVEFGSIKPIEVDVTDVLRLNISASRVGDGGFTILGLGNAQLIGGAASGE